MRGLLAGSLMLSASLWTAAATAGDTPSPVIAPDAAIMLGRPEAVAAPAAPISLDRPVAIAVGDDATATQPAHLDRQVKPVSFSPSQVALPSLGPSIIRGQSSDAPLPMPAGPGLETDPPPLATPGTLSTNAVQKPESLPSMPQPMPQGPNEPPAVTLSEDCDDGTDCCDDSCTPGRCRCLRPLCWLKDLWRPGECLNEPYVFWVEADYLLWAIKDSPLPPLVTTSPAGTPRAQAGVIGAPGTAVLFGGNELDNEARSGLRLDTGFWFDKNQCLGIEAGYFFLGQRSVDFDAGSPGSPILARPFFDVNSGVENSELIAYPGVLAGSIAVRATSQLWGTELDLRGNWLRGCCWRIDWLAGFRYLALDEGLSLSENLMIPTGPQAGTGIFVNDSFGTHNSFAGGQLGLEAELRQGRWSLTLLGKVALGDMQETVNIAGSTAFAVPGLPLNVQPGGLLAQPTNIGHYDRDRFAVVPEAGIKIGYQISKRWRAFVGYSFLYASDVVRPGNQIDRAINVTQLPSVLGPGTLVGAARPAFTFQSTDFWAQGINIGLEFRW
jgi:Putative beta barrel porin-7 (BBP7)